MIEVVGVSPRVKITKTCWNCASILRFVPADIRATKFKDMSGCVEIVYFIDCPTCNRRVVCNNSK